MAELWRLPAVRVLALLDRREISTRELALSLLARIEEVEPSIGAFLTLRSQSEILADAEELDARRRRNEPIGLLGGLFVALKDNICTRNLVTTCGSKMLASFVPPYDATVVDRIREADGIVLGKTNMDEFAMGSSTENSAYKITRNPYSYSHVPGGTSGGSAAAVGSFMSPLALGSDTGGSVRQPAAFCGIYGLKPTYGRVSRYGLISYASSFDQIGPFGRSIRDVDLLYRVIAGHDSKDSTSARLDDACLNAVETPRRRLTIGIPKEYVAATLHPAVKRCTAEVIRRLDSLGHQIEDVSLPSTKFATPTYYIIASAEASANLARYSGVLFGHREAGSASLNAMIASSRAAGFGPEVRRRIILGTYCLSAGYHDQYYLHATRVRTLIVREFEEVLRKVDLLLAPVSPTPPFRLGEKTGDPLDMYLVDTLSVTANVAGIPALALPAGKSDDGLPVGIQLMGKRFGESDLLSCAYELEVAATNGSSVAS